MFTFTFWGKNNISKVKSRGGGICGSYNPHHLAVTRSTPPFECGQDLRIKWGITPTVRLYYTAILQMWFISLLSGSKLIKGRWPTGARWITLALWKSPDIRSRPEKSQAAQLPVSSEDKNCQVVEGPHGSWWPWWPLMTEGLSQNRKITNVLGNQRGRRHWA